MADFKSLQSRKEQESRGLEAMDDKASIGREAAPAMDDKASIGREAAPAPT